MPPALVPIQANPTRHAPRATVSTISVAISPASTVGVSAIPVPALIVSTNPESAAATSTNPVTGRRGRLTRRAEFLRVAAKGRKAAMPGLVLQALQRGDDAPARLGFTVTKKVGNAVIRNRTRRRLKEAARLLLREHPVAGADLVLVGRDATRSRDFVALQADLRQALGKAGVL